MNVLTKALYVIFFALGALLSFYKVGLFASILNKPEFGLYVLVMSSYVYFIYFFSLGANEYLLKLGSVEECKENKQEIRNIALVHGVLALVLGIVTIKPLSLFFDIEVERVFDAAAIIAVSALIFSIFETYFRTERSFLKFSGMMFSKSLLSIIFIEYSNNLESFEQAILVEIFSFWIVIGIVLIYLLFNKSTFFTTISVGNARLILKDGFSFCLSAMLKNSLTLLDKLAISALFGAVLLGYYGFVFIIYQAGILASGVIMSVLGPKILVLAKKKGGAKIEEKIFIASVALIVLGALLYFVASNIYGWVVVNYFPKYDSSITYELFLVVYIASVVVFISSMWDWLFVASSMEKLLVYFSVLSLLAFCIGLVFVWYNKMDIMFVGFAFLLAKVFLLFLQVFYFRLCRI